MQLGRFKVGSTADIIGPNTKMSTLLWAPSGTGKTRLAGTLDAMTQKFCGKPTLCIATEAGEGGGAVTNSNLKIPLIVPRDHNELVEILTSLRTDRQFGGVIFDNATEAAKRYAQPYALAFPSREKKATRTVGVPERSDYQTMGEIVRQYFQALINLTTDPNPELRKHLIIVAADKIREDDDHNIIYWGPDLPGAMAAAASQMMQTVVNLSLKREVRADPTNPKVTVARNRRYLNSAAEGAKVLKDRFKLLPPSLKIRDFDDPQSDGEDLCSIWTNYWQPAIARAAEPTPAV